MQPSTCPDQDYPLKTQGKREQFSANKAVKFLNVAVVAKRYIVIHDHQKDAAFPILSVRLPGNSLPHQIQVLLNGLIMTHHNVPFIVRLIWNFDLPPDFLKNRSE